MRKVRKTFSLSDEKAKFVAKIALGQLKDLNEDEQDQLNDIVIDLDIEDDNKALRKVAIEILESVFQTKDALFKARELLADTFKDMETSFTTEREKRRLALMKDLKRASHRSSFLFEEVGLNFKVIEEASLTRYEIQISEALFFKYIEFVSHLNSNYFAELTRSDLKITAYVRINSAHLHDNNVIVVSSALMKYFKRPAKLRVSGMYGMDVITSISFIFYGTKEQQEVNAESAIEFLLKDMPAISVGQEFKVGPKQIVCVSQVLDQQNQPVFCAALPLDGEVPYKIDTYDLALTKTNIACNGCKQMTGIGQCCQDVHYCSIMCQKKDWKNHMKTCMRKCLF